MAEPLTDSEMDELLDTAANDLLDYIRATDDRPALPDPADYCSECGQPLNRCNAWNNGDHNLNDLL